MDGLKESLEFHERIVSMLQVVVEVEPLIADFERRKIADDELSKAFPERQAKFEKLRLDCAELERKFSTLKTIEQRENRLHELNAAIAQRESELRGANQRYDAFLEQVRRVGA
jgi:hypothetical protein